MSSFTYNDGIPATPNNPTEDQPDMLTNTQSIKSIIDVDHYTFGSTGSNDGYHKVIRLPFQGSDPGLLANIGQLYTKQVSGVTQLFYETNTGVISQLSNSGSLLPRAAVNFTVSGGVVTIRNSFNVSSVTRSSAGVFVVNFTSAISTQYYYPAISCQGDSGVTFTSNVTTFATYIPTTTNLTITTDRGGTARDPVFASVVVFA